MAANPVEAFLFSICAVPIYLLVGSMIGACFLQVSVRLHNKLADQMRYDGLIQVPSIGIAMGIMLLINLVLISMAVFIEIGIRLYKVNLSLPGEIGFRGSLVFLNLFIMMLMLAFFLRAPIARAFWITCLHTALTLLVIAPIAGTLAYIFMAG